MRSILTVWIQIYTDLLLGSVNRVSVMVLTNRQYFTLIKSSRICFSSFKVAPCDDWSMRNVIFPNDPIARINLFNSQDLLCNSPYCLPYNCYDVNLENLVLNQLTIPELIFFFILITCMLNIVLIM